MNPNATEIESIVRKVLETLVGTDLQSVASNPSDELTLSARVISIAELKNQTKGIKRIFIQDNAVVTPAARDLCREAKIEILRGNPMRELPKNHTTATDKPNHRQRLIVAGSSANLPSIARQLCPKQALVLASSLDDSTALREITNGLRDGHQAGILVAQSAYSVCWQAGRDDRLRPVVLSQWSELKPALNEVPTNLLILAARQWNVPAACNVAREFFEHLRRTQ